MLDRVEPRTFGEHPAGEDALNFAVQLDLVDFDKRRGMRRLGWRPRIADARRDFQRAELNRLADRNLQMGDAAGDLVEGSEHGDGVFDLVGQGRLERNACNEDREP
jgi:hypothetical protein